MNNETDKPTLIAIIFLLLITISLGIGGFLLQPNISDEPIYTPINNITLPEIADRFNSTEIINEYNNMGININATTNNTTLLIQSNDEILMTFELNDTILSGTFVTDNFLINLERVGKAVIVAVLELHGNDEEEILRTLTSDEFTSYTLEEEGLELRTNNGYITISINIRKQIPLIDFSNLYIQESDLEEFAPFILNNVPIEKTKGNIIFHNMESSEENQIIFIIGEKNALSELSYKSIISTLNIIFDRNNDTITYFQTNYPTLGGNSEFNGFIIEINPPKTMMEHFVLGDRFAEFVRITVNKNQI